MRPIILCEAPNNNEYFVFDMYDSKDEETLQCIGDYSQSFWRYVVIHIQGKSKKSAQVFLKDEDLIKFLGSKNIYLGGIKTRCTHKHMRKLIINYCKE